MFDREAIIAAVDLVKLADEMLGPGRGSRRSATWPCPNPAHPQTGRTPPVSVFTSRAGQPRWHCHGCGIGGTAIDLVMHVRGVTARGALEELAGRAGVPSVRGGTLHRAGHPGGAPDRASPVAPNLVPRPVPELDRYVAECAAALWTPQGEPVLRWLTGVRGVPEEVLRVNRVGADLGFQRQARPAAVPRVRRAVVLPVLVAGGACFAQLRVLNSGPDFPRYLNARDEQVPNPRVGLYRPARHFDFPCERGELIVTEGIIDALSAAAAGYHAAGVLGAGLTDPLTALKLARVPRPLVIAFDPDAAGQAGAHRLVEHLTGHRRNAHLLQLRNGDLNENMVRATEWPLEMAARVEQATHRRDTHGRVRSVS